MGYFVSKGFEERTVCSNGHAADSNCGLDNGPDCDFESEKCEVLFGVPEAVDVDDTNDNGETGTAFPSACDPPQKKNNSQDTQSQKSSNDELRLAIHLQAPDYK